MTPLPQDKQATDVDWSSLVIQQTWFDRFKSANLEGLEFQHFQSFLQESLYKFLDRYPTDNEIKTNNDNDAGTNQENTSNNTSDYFTHLQEQQLFEKFDLNHDHMLDWHEFSRVCQKWLKKIYNPSSALVVVDVQNDFIDGSLALIKGPAGQDGVEVVPVINDLIDNCGFDSIVYTQDWHPVDHIGFHANLHMRKFKLKQNSQQANDVKDESELTASSCKFKLKKLVAKAKLYDTVLFEDGQVEQKLWPTHCVQNSWGAQLHPKLRIHPDAIRIYKGTLPHVDAYSAFWDNMRLNETGLRQELVTRDISDLFFCGLAFDYCVSASAMDAAKAGFVTFVIEDACRGIDEQEINLRRDELTSNGVIILGAEVVKGYLARGDKHLQQVKTSNRNLDRNTMKSICFRRALTMI